MLDLALDVLFTRNGSEEREGGREGGRAYLSDSVYELRRFFVVVVLGHNS